MAGSISSLGVGSGLQLQDILDQLREVDDQAIIQPKEEEISTYQDRLDEISTVETKLYTLKSDALSLSLSSTFLARSVSSSDESVVTATVSDGAVVQDAAISVTSLAKKSSWLAASGFADTTDSVASTADTLVYQVGTTTVTVDVAAGTTLAELVDLINDDSDNPGVTASIIDDGSSTPYKLLLQADDTGEDNRISITSQLADLTLAEQNGAGGSSLNAQFTVDNIAYQRQSNTFNDVWSGVTITLVDAGSATLSVAADNDAVSELITGFVEAYNDVVQEVKSNTAWDEDNEEFGVLAGTTLRDLPFDLQNLMTQTIEADSDGNVTSLFDLGMEFNRDGTITIDSDTLTTAIANYSDGIQAFFLGDSANDITGLADLVNERLRTILADTGQIGAEKTAAEEHISNLQDEITAQTERLDKRYELLTRQFIELDRFMSQMTSMSDFLNSQFQSLTSLWGGGKK